MGTTCGATALLLARDRMPERIGGVLAIGHFWALEAAELAALPTVHRTFFKLARHAPAILYTIAAVGWRIIQKFGPDWYMERAHTYSERNRRSMRDPEVLALLRADCAMLLAQGYQAFVNDMLLAQAATSDAIERATRPTLWMIGSCDQHYSRDRVLARRARHAGLTVHIIDGASELMLYQRPELIAAALSSLARGEPFTQPDTPSTAGAER